MREGVIHPVRVYDEWEAMLVMDLSSVSNVQIGTDIIGPSTLCNFVHTLSISLKMQCPEKALI